MSVRPDGGGAYAYPDQGTTNPEPLPESDPPSIRRGDPGYIEPDSIPERPLPRDPDYIQVPNPDGSEAGPLYLTPEAEQWLNENVWDRGLVVDWGTREIFDPNTGEVKGIVPRTFPRMA